MLDDDRVDRLRRRRLNLSQRPRIRRNKTSSSDLATTILLDDFHEALGECQILCREATTEALEQEPHLAGLSPAEFSDRLHQLHQRMLVKVFYQMVRTDGAWSEGELDLAEILRGHIWLQALPREELHIWFHDYHGKMGTLSWDEMLRPFAQFASLGEYACRLATQLIRVANIVAKIDGTLHDESRNQLAQLDRDLLNRLCTRSTRSTESTTIETVESVSAESPQAAVQVPVPLAPASDEPRRPAETNAEPELSREEQLQLALAELNALIGLDSVKQEVGELASFLKVQGLRAQFELKQTDISMHMVFTGNPGTGKTTVARLVGRIFSSLGVLKKGHLVETDRSGLVAKYMGQTAPQTNAKIDEALDGILFIDEAYSLTAEDGRDTYGDEALQTLLKRAEDDRSRLAIILAGYPGPMGRMLRSNPGLSSRFAKHLAFPDYSSLDLCRIFALFCKKNQYTLTPAARFKLLICFELLASASDEHFGNGRLARNVFERAIRRLAHRIASIAPITRELLTQFHSDDLQFDGISDDVLNGFQPQHYQATSLCPQCQSPTEHEALLLGCEVSCCQCTQSFTTEWSELTRRV